jgi:hypothetical protein
MKKIILVMITRNCLSGIRVGVRRRGRKIRITFTWVTASYPRYRSNLSLPYLRSMK